MGFTAGYHQLRPTQGESLPVRSLTHAKKTSGIQKREFRNSTSQHPQLVQTAPEWAPGKESFLELFSQPPVLEVAGLTFARLSVTLELQGFSVASVSLPSCAVQRIDRASEKTPDGTATEAAWGPRSDASDDHQAAGSRLQVGCLAMQQRAMVWRGCFAGTEGSGIRQLAGGRFQGSGL